MFKLSIIYAIFKSISKKRACRNGYISSFCTSYYISSIQNLSLHLPHVRILGTCHCVNTRSKVFKFHSYFQYVMCHRDYVERVVACFAHQFQYEYYGGNRSFSIKGIALESSSPVELFLSLSRSKYYKRHAVLHFFVRWHKTRCNYNICT